MMIIGLTGSIGMGKSTLAKQFESLGAKIICADNVAHTLMAKGGAAVGAIDNAFPGAVKSGAVDRKSLGEMVFHDKAKLAKLEAILHPLIQETEDRFAEKHMRLGAKIVVMDIPLLFETGGEERCDLTVLASAPHFLQAQRVLIRMHMTEAKFKSILAKQMPDREKRARADFIISTGLGKAHSFRQVKTLMRMLHET